VEKIIRAREGKRKRFGQARILVVDDEPAIRLSLSKALSLEGYYIGKKMALSEPCQDNYK